MLKIIMAILVKGYIGKLGRTRFADIANNLKDGEHWRVWLQWMRSCEPDVHYNGRLALIWEVATGPQSKFSLVKVSENLLRALREK